jgi:DNA-binding Lrp family transcriptional regulator
LKELTTIEIGRTLSFITAGLIVLSAKNSIIQKIKAMINAIILINAERTKINSVAEQLVSLAGITDVYSVSGRFDLVVVIRLPHADDLAELMTEKVIKVEGITKTESMVAFKTFSKSDIANMFELGN